MFNRATSIVLGAVGALGLAATLFACSNDSSPTVPTGANATPAARHVFVIMLENKNYEDTFGSSTQDP